MGLALYCLQGGAHSCGNSRETDGPPQQKVYESRSLQVRFLKQHKYLWLCDNHVPVTCSKVSGT